jgi:hypothetical protein
MSFFGIGKPRRYVTESSLRRNMQKQLALTPQTLAALRERGAPKDAAFRLEYFFYSPSRDNAAALADALKLQGYSVQARPSPHDKDLFIITGWSTPVPIQEESLRSWTVAMGGLGFAHDCEFDGWGTTVDGSGGDA